MPWLVYARQPDCVFFSHAAHIYGAEMECRTCHGDIGTSESLKPYEENRITGYSRDISSKRSGMDCSMACLGNGINVPVG